MIDHTMPQKTLNIMSWNVNGIRAAEKKGFIDWVNQTQPDILGLQETKAHPDQLSEALHNIPGYLSYFAAARRKGYSGVGIYTKKAPALVEEVKGIRALEGEGRILHAEYDSFTLFNVYFPNGGASPERLKYKLDFYDAFLAHVEKVRTYDPHIIICGDVNTAHKEVDLARPKENAKNTGFLPEERAWIDRLVSHGFIDTFREFHTEPEQYTWWDMKTRSRDRNVGWRIDYFFISEALRPRLKNANIHADVLGSDHCPVSIELAV
jgi:exodeoxyribonuclease-3